MGKESTWAFLFWKAAGESPSNCYTEAQVPGTFLYTFLPVLFLFTLWLLLAVEIRIQAVHCPEPPNSEL